MSFNYSLRLGPRLIPIFRDIVNECVALLRETQQRQPGMFPTGRLYDIHQLIVTR